MKKTSFIHFVVAATLFTLMSTQKIFAGYYPFYAPYPDQATAKTLMSRPLVIELRTIKEKERQKLMKNDPEELKFQEDYNAYYNQTLKDYFSSKYTGSKEITFMNPTSIDSLVKSGTSKYAILRGGSLERFFVVGGKQMKKDTYSFSMFLSEKENPELVISFIQETLTDSDFLFLLQQINEIIKNASSGGSSPDYETMNKNFPDRINGKKLLIPESLLNEKLTKEDIQKAYTLPLEFVSNEDYEAKLKSESKDYVYLTGSFSASLQGYTCNVISAENGQILLAMAVGGVTFYVHTRPSKEQMKSLGYSMASLSDRNKYSVTLFTTKPKFSVKDSHFAKMMKLAKK